MRSTDEQHGKHDQRGETRLQNPVEGADRAQPQTPEVPEEPALPGVKSSILWKPILFPIGLFAVAFVLTWLRLPATARDSLWAEDGSLFLQQATTGSPWLHIFTPYAGYLHVLPRIITAVVWDVAPVTLLPQAMAAGSVAVTAGVAVLVYYLSGHVGVRKPGRIALYALTFLAPALAVEALGNVANLHWFFLWLAPWLFLARPRSRWGGRLLGVVALVAALTEPQVLFFAPLVLWRLRAHRKEWVAVGAGIGIVAQLAVTILVPRDAGASLYAGMDALVRIAAGYVIQVGGAQWFTMSPVVPLLQSVGWVAGTLIIFSITIAAVGLAIWWRLPNATRMLVVLLPASVVLWYASCVVNDAARSGLLGFVDDVGDSQPAGTFGIVRYALVPALMLSAVLILVADESLARAGRINTAVAVVALLILATASVFSYYGGQAVLRQPTVSWAQSVAVATATCEAEDGLTAYPLPIQPTGWYFSVPCAQLTR